MNVTVEEAKTPSELKKFVKFPFRLYSGHPCWVPPLISDELALFDPAKNPGYENTESRQFIAYKDGVPAGRVAAILSHVANKKNGTKNMRFNWFDSIDDLQVAQSLFDAVTSWARERELTSLTGPHGFCDFDPNGMLVEGFDELANGTSNYNHPYYPELMEKMGFQKEIDYVEYKTMVPHDTGLPEKLLHLSERVKERSGFHLVKFRNVKHIMQRAEEVFDVLQEAYEEIYGAVPLTEKQIQYYIKKYMPYVDPDLIKVVANNRDEIIGFLITMPSLSKAFQKARGRLLPFGWVHILRGLKQHEIIDFLLAGVRKQYRGQGVDLIMTVEIVKTVLEKGFHHSESTQELETNTKVQAQWKYFNPVRHKRRRVFRKTLG